MAIQSISAKATDSLLQKKPTTEDTVKNNNLAISKKSNDSIDITAVAKEITKALDSSNASPAIDETRVKAVKEALENGSYPINAEHIAEKMIQLEREQFDSR